MALIPRPPRPPQEDIHREHVEQRAALCLSEAVRQNIKISDDMSAHVGSLAQRGWLVIQRSAAVYRGTPAELAKFSGLHNTERSERFSESFLFNHLQPIERHRIEFKEFREHTWEDVQKRRKPNPHTVTTVFRCYRATFSTPWGLEELNEQLYRTAEKQARALKIVAWYCAQQSDGAPVHCVDESTGESFAVIMPMRRD